MADETATQSDEPTDAATPSDEEQPIAEQSAAEAATDAGEPTLADGLTMDGGAADEEAVEPAVIRGKIDRFGVALGTGRRKTAVARVRLKDGDGKLTINGRELEHFFTTDRDRQYVLAPLRATGSLGKMDVWVRVNGGGTTGQAGAIVLGIARALQAKDPLLHHTLSVGGYLTRDSRMVERKKYGLKKARRSFQFSKR